MAEPLLTIENLGVDFHDAGGAWRAVENLDLSIPAGRTLGLVGESGCGKTVTALAIMGLLPPGAHIRCGSIRLAGRELTALDDRDYRRLRGATVALVGQQAMTALNPIRTIGAQIREVLGRHRGMNRRPARNEAVAMLERLAVDHPGRRLEQYPHQLSGGLRQRVLVAMAMACRPALLIADEATTALDVTNQAQLLGQLKALQAEFGTTMLIISHDLAVVAGTCDHVAIMYAGRLVEQAGINAIFHTPRHPYTAGLLDAVPDLDARPAGQLKAIPGQVPDPAARPAGCRFAPRCPRADRHCRRREPDLTETDEGEVRCYYPLDAEPLS